MRWSGGNRRSRNSHTWVQPPVLNYCCWRYYYTSEVFDPSFVGSTLVDTVIHGLSFVRVSLHCPCLPKIEMLRHVWFKPFLIRIMIPSFLKESYFNDFFNFKSLHIQIIWIEILLYHGHSFLSLNNAKQ